MSTDALAAPGPAAAPVCGCPIDADFPALRMVCAAPPIYVVENFLSAQQCVEMIEGSRPDLRESLAHNAGAHEGEGPVIRNALTKKYGLMTGPLDTDFQSMYDVFAQGGLAARPHAPCLGSRVRPDGTVGAYEWQT